MLKLKNGGDCEMPYVQRKYKMAEILLLNKGGKREFCGGDDIYENNKIFMFPFCVSSLIRCSPLRSFFFYSIVLIFYCSSSINSYLFVLLRGDETPREKAEVAEKKEEQSAEQSAAEE